MLVSSISTGHWSFPIQKTYRMQFYHWVTRRRPRTAVGNPIQYSVPSRPFCWIIVPSWRPFYAWGHFLQLQVFLLESFLHLEFGLSFLSYTLLLHIPLNALVHRL